jgi:hypothetical protein
VSDAFTVIIAPEAVIEVSEIAIWWNEDRPAAPRLFQTELDRALLRLAICRILGAVERITSEPSGEQVRSRRAL